MTGPRRARTHHLQWRPQHRSRRLQSNVEYLRAAGGRLGDTVLVVCGAGGNACTSHVSNLWSLRDWGILQLVEAARYQDAQAKINSFNATFGEFRAEMEAKTGGEGHATKKLIELAGRVGDSGPR